MAGLILGGLLIVAASALAIALLLRPDPLRIGGSALLNRPAPDFELDRLDGPGTVRLADYRGRPVVVNFWASWCIPCRAEFPLLRDARAEHAADGLEVLGIVHDDGPQAARSFAREYGATWPLLLDPDSATWRDYGGLLLPITYFIDREGIVRAVSFGPPPREVFDQQLAKIL